MRETFRVPRLTNLAISQQPRPAFNKLFRVYISL